MSKTPAMFLATFLNLSTIAASLIFVGVAVIFFGDGGSTPLSHVGLIICAYVFAYYPYAAAINTLVIVVSFFFLDINRASVISAIIPTTAGLAIAISTVLRLW